MITLRQIQFALAVSRHKHFKRAAEECNISQSALSLGIAEMEKNLGVIVFERNNKQVVITPIGEELLRRAQQIYLDAQQLVEHAHAGQETLRFPMSIGFIPTVAPYLLPQALPVIREAYPYFEFNIREDASERLIASVHNGIIDAAVIALPYETPGLNTFEFWQERFFVVVHKDNPLGQQEKISPKQLRQGNLLLLSEGHCLKDHIIDICKFRDGISPDSFREASLNTLVQMAINNMGITLVPEIALPSLQIHKDIRTILLDVAAPHRRLAVIVRPNYPRTSELETLIELFKTALNRRSPSN
ncbi:MAG: hydrogen peroxide-inducible genes activator [Cardiobacteriaceae bacterium]|nr:hydrogen peroxide-inducible genes activator [Cardiobacteriaceae bacterium]